MRFFACLLVTLFLIGGEANVEYEKIYEGEETDVASGRQEKISFTPPELSEEEQLSHVMSKPLRCDACKAVATQTYLALKTLKNKKGKTKIKEFEYTAVLDRICTDKVYENYGAKQVDGVTILSGEGLLGSNAASMMVGGGLWSTRIANVCGEVVGAIGDDEIYDAFSDGQDLVMFMCYDQTKFCQNGKGAPQKEL